MGFLTIHAIPLLFHNSIRHGHHTARDSPRGHVLLLAGPRVLAHIGLVECAVKTSSACECVALAASEPQRGRTEKLRLTWPWPWPPDLTGQIVEVWPTSWLSRKDDSGS